MSNTTANIPVRIKRGQKANLSTAGVLSGELKYVSDENALYIGNGTTNIKIADKVIIECDELPTTNIENVIYHLKQEQMEGGKVKYRTGLYYNYNSSWEIIKEITNAYASLVLIDDYLYDATYETLDYDYAYTYFNDLYNNKETTTSDEIINSWAASIVRNGNFFGRNYDGLYNNDAEYIIRTSNKGGKYATIGLASGITELSNDMAKKQKFSEKYRALPFMTLDGINDRGVLCSIATVPTSDKGKTTGTHPEKSLSMCMLMIPRYILDNFDNAYSACIDIRDNVNVYAPYSDTLRQEFHFIVADVHSTYCLEFINNTCNIVDLTSTKPYATNFYLKDVGYNADGTVDKTTVTDHGVGLERYNYITTNYASLTSFTDMARIMKDLYYTQVYSSTSFSWYTDYASKTTTYGDLTINSSESEYSNILSVYRGKYAARTRDNPETLHTTHTAVYNIPERTLNIYIQEGSIYYTYTLGSGSDLQINGVTLEGNKTGTELGLVNENQGTSNINKILKVDGTGKLALAENKHIKIVHSLPLTNIEDILYYLDTDTTDYDKGLYVYDTDTSAYVKISSSGAGIEKEITIVAGTTSYEIDNTLGKTNLIVSLYDENNVEFITDVKISTTKITVEISSDVATADDGKKYKLIVKGA